MGDLQHMGYFDACFSKHELVECRRMNSFTRRRRFTRHLFLGAKFVHD